MKTILVVDNTPLGRDCVVNILNKCGYRVIVAQTGAEALSALHADFPIDLIISEYQMPDMDGIVFVANIKTFFPDLPVIMVTACGSIETYIKTLSLGVFEYMNKPIMAHELRKVVKAAMENPLSDSAVNF
jgi:DNA-binding NtrC family response regulator